MNSASFSAFGLPDFLLQNVKRIGYTLPTPVQLQTIPAVLGGHDVLAAAQTGTGKTAAFALPLIARMRAGKDQRRPKSTRTLILAPTRELAAQIHENIRAYAVGSSLVSTLVFGGVNIRPQIEQLSGGTDFLVATPGRLLDLVGQRALKLDTVTCLVLDEADRMLDMGFIHDIRKVLALIPQDRQTLLFSATFNDEIKALASSLLHDPVLVEIEKNKEAALIRQEALLIAKKRKRELLRDLIVDRHWEQVLVFTRMKHAANRLAEQLVKDGITAAAIHGNKSQSARTKALAGFKAHTIRVLVATDIAARGLDIEALPHVVNYELPDVAEDYVHRIGRTGRAGLEGHAVSLVSSDEMDNLKAIERLLKKKLPLTQVQGYEGPVPEDIAEDEKRRDAARQAELERLRASRRAAKAKTSAKKGPVHEAQKPSRKRGNPQKGLPENVKETPARGLGKTSPTKKRGNPLFSKGLAQHLSSTVKSTVHKVDSQRKHEPRYEAVSSNLPPGMLLRIRRRSA